MLDYIFKVNHILHFFHKTRKQPAGDMQAVSLRKAVYDEFDGKGVTSLPCYTHSILHCYDRKRA